VGKFKAIDSIRREARGRELITQNLAQAHELATEQIDHHVVDDDQLRLIFYCCNPSLPSDSRIALALREVCGLTTDEIARAFLTGNETIKKRISRAKALIKEKNIPYEIPSKEELGERLSAAFHVVYLIYNEGYSASFGEDLLRKELTDEAVFLARRLVELIPCAEGLGLLALFLFQESRREARTDVAGDLIPLEKQDRLKWDQAMIAEGVDLVHQAVMSGKLGPYCLQAAIASVHASAASVATTPWELIVGYYEMLLSINRSPVIELNRAIAIGMRDGPGAALSIIDGLKNDPKLSSYHGLYSAMAEFSKRLGRDDDARDAYETAIRLATQGPEKKYLKQQLANLVK